MDEKTELPEKYDLEKFWVDDARIVAKINTAIELAEQAKWAESEAMLERAKDDIEDWEPYDTSDVYYKGIWSDTIARVRAYNTQNNLG